MINLPFYSVNGTGEFTSLFKKYFGSFLLEPFYFIYLCHPSQSLFTLPLSLCEKVLYSQLDIWSILCTPFFQHIYLFLLSWSSNTPCYCPQISLYSSPVCAINAQTFSFRYSHSMCLSSHHEKHCTSVYSRHCSVL